MREPPTIGRLTCRRCTGHGYVWTSELQDGFERNGRWEICERCNRSGYEPEPKREDPEDA